MTINIEQQTLLTVLESQPSLRGPLNDVDDGCLFVDFRKSIAQGDFHVEKIRASTSDDEDSVGTFSTASLSDSSEELDERRVSFADELVTDVWEREYTPKEEIPDLFYSTEDTQRFRQEYRLERKLLNGLSSASDNLPIDPEELPSSLALTSSVDNNTSTRHHISRVVVMHNDKLETFYGNSPDHDFFDNDSFWSGSITWY